MKTTLDGILNNKIKIEQPADGYRVAIDTIFLAAAVPALKGQKILDIGCGVGGVMLALAARVPACEVEGIDIQRPLVDLCRANINRNDLQERLFVREGDVADLPSEWKGHFDHVVMNPPYHDAKAHDASPNAIKKKANWEPEGDLSLWIASAAQALRPDGMLTMIHRADRADEIAELLASKLPALTMKFLEPKKGTSPKRVLIRAMKGEGSKVTTKPFTLHYPTGPFTEAAELILREGQALEF